MAAFHNPCPLQQSYICRETSREIWGATGKVEVNLIYIRGGTCFTSGVELVLCFGGEVAKAVGANSQWGEFTTNKIDKCNSSLAGSHIRLYDGAPSTTKALQTSFQIPSLLLIYVFQTVAKNFALKEG